MAIGIGMDGLAALVADRYLMPRLNLVALLVVGSVALTLTRNVSRVMARQRRGPARLALIGPLNERAHVRKIIDADETSLIVVAESETTTELHNAGLSSNVPTFLSLTSTPCRRLPLSIWRVSANQASAFTNEFPQRKLCWGFARCDRFQVFHLRGFTLGLCHRIKSA